MITNSDIDLLRSAYRMVERLQKEHKDDTLFVGLLDAWKTDTLSVIAGLERRK